MTDLLPSPRPSLEILRRQHSTTLSVSKSSGSSKITTSSAKPSDTHFPTPSSSSREPDFPCLVFLRQQNGRLNEGRLTSLLQRCSRIRPRYLQQAPTSVVLDDPVSPHVSIYIPKTLSQLLIGSTFSGRPLGFGDFFVNKSAGSVVIEHPSLGEIEIFTTHVRAPLACSGH